MKAEIITRLMMILTGFVLAMLGVIVFIHGEHYPIGVLIIYIAYMLIMLRLWQYKKIFIIYCV